jgi:hypothetical protein
MSIPDLCQACHTYHPATVVNACPLCRDVQGSENRLCDLARDHGGSEQPFHGHAFRPMLSVVHHGRTEVPPLEEGSAAMVRMSPQHRWCRAYAVQQLGSNPDLIAFMVRYHVVCSTRPWVNVFASEHREQIADMVQYPAFPTGLVDLTVPVRVVMDPSQAHDADVLMVTVKTYNMVAALATCCPSLPVRCSIAAMSSRPCGMGDTEEKHGHL